MDPRPLHEVRDHLGDVIDQVQRDHERVAITRDGRTVAVVVNPADLAALEETLVALSDPEVPTDVREADAAYARGDVVRGVDAVRALRTDSRPGHMGVERPR